MTLTSDATTATAPDPDLLEVLMWNRGLKTLFWTVGEAERVDETDPETTLVATLRVVWTNGKRHFLSDPVLDYDVIYALVGSDEVSAEATDLAVSEILAHSHEIDPRDLSDLEDDPTWASALDGRRHTDGDLLRGAAQALGDNWGALLEALGSMVDELPPGLSYASTKSRVASIAVQIAWDLL